MTQNYLTEKQVCEKLKISRSTLSKLRNNHFLPAYKLGGGALRFNEVELEGWLKLQKMAVDGLDVDNLEKTMADEADKEESTNE